MLNPTTIRSISDLRNNPLAVLKTAKDLEEPVYIFYRTTPWGAVLSIDDLDNLMTELEDLKDALEVVRRQKDRRRKLVPWERVKKELNL